MPEEKKKIKDLKDVNRSAKLKTANFVRRVLSRTSNHSKTSLEAEDCDKSMEGGEKSSVNFESELQQLKKQIETLQSTVYSMRSDTERKDKVLESVVKEKEQLTSDLRKQRRSNVDLKRQLDEERSFYYKEKEQYCAEMSSYKKLRQKDDKETVGGYKKKVAYLEGALNQALEANYNLSVKFLRMKNTKLSLKHQLVKLKELHDFSVRDFGAKLEDLRKELEDLATRQFLKPIPPSNKKYLQIIKHNGKLIHENLCLQVEVDRLTLELERMKMRQIRSETNSKLKYIRSDDTRKSKSIGKRTSEPNTTTETDTKITLLSKVEESIAEQEIVKVPPQPPPPPSLSLDTTQSRIELMNVSNSNLSSRHESDVTYYTSLRSYEACRTQSAPEIVQNVKSLD